MGTNNLLEKTQYQMTSSHVLTTYYSGKKEENDVFNSESRSEVCSVAEQDTVRQCMALGCLK